MTPARAAEQGAGSAPQADTGFDTMRAVLPRLIFAWLSNVVALFVAAWIIGPIDYGDDFWVLFIAALVFTIVNVFVRPLVILLALPAVVLTLGLALILINTLMLYLTDWIVPSFETGSFWATLGGAVIVSIVNLILNLVLKPDERLRAD
jgi:putative membrane protein